MKKYTCISDSNRNSQTGAVLVISLIMLLLLSIIGVTGTQSTGLEEKMSGNIRDRNLAFQAAESALAAAENSLSPTLPTFVTTTTNGSSAAATPTSSGYYKHDAVRPAVENDAFWSYNGNYQTYSSSLTGVGTAPKYTIHQMDQVDCPGSAVGSMGCRYYRVTARATGGTTNAVVMLQSIYIR